MAEHHFPSQKVGDADRVLLGNALHVFLLSRLVSHFVLFLSVFPLPKHAFSPFSNDGLLLAVGHSGHAAAERDDQRGEVAIGRLG